MSAKKNWRCIKIGEDSYTAVKKEKERIEGQEGIKIQFRAVLDMIVKKGLVK